MTLATPPEKDSDTKKQNDAPKFGRLLIVLLFAVMLIVIITFASEAYYTD